jgi:hypothetical protein
MAVKSSKGKASIKAAATRLATKKSGATDTRPTTRTIKYKSGNSITQTLVGDKYVTTNYNKIYNPKTGKQLLTTNQSQVGTPRVSGISTTTPTPTVPRVTPTVNPATLSSGAMGPTAHTTPSTTVSPVALQTNVEDFINNNNPSKTGVFNGPQQPGFQFATPKVAPAAATTTPAAPTGPTREERIAEAMRKAQEIQAQVQELKAKQTTPVETAITSDEEIVNQEDAALKAIGYESPTNKALILLDDEINRLRDNLRADTQAINQVYNSQRSSTEDAQNREAGQLSVGLANAGGYLGFSGSGTGVMLTLANSHRDELLKLEAERSKAVMEARIASENRRFDLVQLKADEIARIDNETYAREQDYLNRKEKLQTAELGRTEKLKMQGDIMEQIKSGITKPQDIFSALKGAYPIEDINRALEGFAPASKSGDLFKFSSNDVASLLGAGLGQDDIAALSDTVNELGYTEEVRQALPSSVRAVADSIYRGKTGGSTSSGVTINGKKISSVALQVLDGFTKMSALTPTIQQQVRDDLYELGFADDTPPDWFDVNSVPDEYRVAKAGLPTYNNQLFFRTDVLQTPGQQTMSPDMFDIQKTWEAYVRGVLSDGEDTGVSEIDAARAVISERTRE